MDVNVKDETINIEQQSGNQVIHVRANSDSEMQALFDCVLKPSGKTPLQVPFKLRNLPPSFFTPPAHRQSPAPISHSREGSADSSYGSGGTPVGGPPPLRVAGAGATAAASAAVSAATASPTSQPQHFRHHSSPASLQPTLSVAPPQQQHVHLKQHSYDALAESPLPSGWEEARTPQGQVYYLNHKTQSTTWEDPRKKSLLSQSNSQQGSSHSISSSQPSPPPPASSQSQLISSQSPTPHLVTTTSILPPLPSSSSAATTIGNLPGITTTSATSSSSSTSSSGSSSGSGSASGIGLLNPNLGPLPPGWQQGVSPEGEVYYINHNDQTTTWFDPRIPRQLQTGAGLKTAAASSPGQQQALQQQQFMRSLPPAGPNGMAASPSVQRQNNYSLHRMQHHDKDRLRRRHEFPVATRVQAEYPQKRAVRGEAPSRNISEIQPPPQLRSQAPPSLPLPNALSSALINSTQAAMQAASLNSNDVSLTSALSLPTSQQGSNNSSSTSSSSSALGSTDPFMAGTTDFHSRQESADSGLGLGVNYTQSTTPDDFLTTIDDGDLSTTDVEMRQNVASPMMVTAELESMDSEDLVPSLSIEGISPELLDEMLVPPSKMNFPTWL